MALGYCMECAKMVSIRPGPQKWGSRECAWYPIEHDNPSGERCTKGPKREIK